MQHQFHVAQQQLAYERNEMHSMEEHDRVKASEQKTKMQRMAAHRQAEEYERHLKALTDSVFPTEVPILEPSSSPHNTHLMFRPYLCGRRCRTRECIMVVCAIAHMENIACMYP